MPRMTSEYEAQVHPDGRWRVALVQKLGIMVTNHRVASGKADDQRRGEIAARMAIEDDKCRRAKGRVESAGTLHFTVRG